MQSNRITLLVFVYFIVTIFCLFKSVRTEKNIEFIVATVNYLYFTEKIKAYTTIQYLPKYKKRYYKLWHVITTFRLIV